MWKIYFKAQAIKQIQNIDRTDQVRIKKKLDYFASQQNPLQFAKKLIDPKLGTYRFRVGDYRIVFDIDQEGNIIIILLVGHRKDIYQ